MRKPRVPARPKPSRSVETSSRPVTSAGRPTAASAMSPPAMEDRSPDTKQPGSCPPTTKGSSEVRSDRPSPRNSLPRTQTREPSRSAERVTRSSYESTELSPWTDFTVILERHLPPGPNPFEPSKAVRRSKRPVTSTRARSTVPPPAGRARPERSPSIQTEGSGGSVGCRSLSSQTPKDVARLPWTFTMVWW